MSDPEREAPTTAEWAANGLAALDHLEATYYGGLDGPGGLKVSTIRAASDAIRAALTALSPGPEPDRQVDVAEIADQLAAMQWDDAMVAEGVRFAYEYLRAASPGPEREWATDDDGDHSAFTHRDDDEPPPYPGPEPVAGLDVWATLRDSLELALRRGELTQDGFTTLHSMVDLLEIETDAALGKKP